MAVFGGGIRRCMGLVAALCLCGIAQAQSTQVLATDASVYPQSPAFLSGTQAANFNTRWTQLPPQSKDQTLLMPADGTGWSWPGWKSLFTLRGGTAVTSPQAGQTRPFFFHDAGLHLQGAPIRPRAGGRLEYNGQGWAFTGLFGKGQLPKTSLRSPFLLKRATGIFGERGLF